MIETRLALPVRSPTPFIVPWTWRAPTSTAASVLATPHSASLWQWMADAHPVAHGGQHRRGRLGDLRRQRRAVGVAQGDRLGARAGRRAQAVQRVAGVVAVAVEEVLGVVDDALARLRRRKATDSAIMARFSARSTRTTFSRCRRPRLADDRAHRREAVGEHAQAVVLGGRHAAPARHAEGGDVGVLEALLGQQLEELELLGVRRREAGLDEVDAELVELARDAHLLGRRQREAGALHAIAQRGVVELDVGHGDLCATCSRTGTGSSHSR